MYASLSIDESKEEGQHKGEGDEVSWEAEGGELDRTPNQKITEKKLTPDHQGNKQGAKEEHQEGSDHTKMDQRSGD